MRDRAASAPFVGHERESARSSRSFSRPPLEEVLGTDDHSRSRPRSTAAGTATEEASGAAPGRAWARGGRRHRYCVAVAVGRHRYRHGFRHGEDRGISLRAQHHPEFVPYSLCQSNSPCWMRPMTAFRKRCDESVERASLRRCRTGPHVDARSTRYSSMNPTTDDAENDEDRQQLCVGDRPIRRVNAAKREKVTRCRCRKARQDRRAHAFSDAYSVDAGVQYRSDHKSDDADRLHEASAGTQRQRSNLEHDRDAEKQRPRSHEVARTRLRICPNERPVPAVAPTSARPCSVRRDMIRARKASSAAPNELRAESEKLLWIEASDLRDLWHLTAAAALPSPRINSTRRSAARGTSSIHNDLVELGGRREFNFRCLEAPGALIRIFSAATDQSGSEFLPRLGAQEHETSFCMLARTCRAPCKSISSSIGSPRPAASNHRPTGCAVAGLVMYGGPFKELGRREAWVESLIVDEEVVYGLRASPGGAFGSSPTLTA
ncbi:hypothetical protein FQA39_LY18888 [Lamprigera yunnana]|nr:hypothetical protein FQA39_LY18888 [Lamprigera yunnana]